MPTPYLVVLLGVLSISGASILVKMSTVDPLVVAFYRLLFSVVLLSVPLLWRRDQPWLSRRDIRLSMVSGVFLAVHFATWFYSIRYTSIASSTVLVNTHPFLVLLYGYFRWGERIKRVGLVGVILAVVGTALIGWGDFGLDQGALWGDFLAFLGAVTVTGYFVIGRDVRQRADALPYSITTYATSTVLLLLAALLSGAQLVGFEPTNWLLFLGMAIFPHIFGHTLFNWALKFLPASVISVNILGEPVGASLLDWFIYGEPPSQLSLIGAVVLLVGIAIFVWDQRNA